MIKLAGVGGQNDFIDILSKKREIDSGELWFNQK